MKKLTLIFAALVCTVLCAFGLVGCDNKAPGGENGGKADGTVGLEYELTADGNSYGVSLPREGNWENADIVIPASYNQKPVTEIKDHGFEDGRIKSVTIPDGVKIIGVQAFCDCENLKTVDFGKGVTEIGDYAFNGTALETVVVPASVKTVGNNAFGKNGLLKSATVNANAVFDDFAFDGCPVLEKVEFLGQDSLTLGAQAFSDCPLLKDLTIAAKDATFVYNTFTECKPTKFAATFETVCKADFSDTIHARYPEELVFLRTETFANDNALYKCRAVKSVTLPATLKACEQSAFSSFKMLETVNYEGTLGEWCGIEFANGSANPIAQGADLVIGGEKVEGKLTVPAAVAKINPYAFYVYGKITELEIAESVTEIGKYAFYKSALRTANLTGGLETVGAHAFESCPLYSVNFSEGLTTIGTQAFASCRLILAVLPLSLESLGKDAFAYNRMLTRMVMTQAQADKGMTPDYTDSLSVYFKTLAEADESAVEKVGDFLFWKDDYGNYFLTEYLGNEKEITLPATVKGNKYAIHAFAFENAGLNKITFEDIADWQSKYGYDAPNDMDVSDPERNASWLQESHKNREWYQK